MDIKEFIAGLGCGVARHLTEGEICLDHMPTIPPPPPVEPKPEINTYFVSAEEIKGEMRAFGIKLMYPIPLDGQYLYTDAEGWAEVVWYIYSKYEFPDWTKDKFDCDDFAWLFCALAKFEFGLGATGFVIGTIPQGGHAYCMIADRDGWKLFEPNPDFPWGCQPFPINGHQYFSNYILI